MVDSRRGGGLAVSTDADLCWTGAAWPWISIDTAWAIALPPPDPVVFPLGGRQPGFAGVGTASPAGIWREAALRGAAEIQTRLVPRSGASRGPRRQRQATAPDGFLALSEDVDSPYKGVVAGRPARGSCLSSQTG